MARKKFSTRKKSNILSTKLRKCILYARQNATEFCNATTLHGMRHIVTPQRHILETLFWLVSLTVATGSAVSLITGTWHRFNAHPTVISLEKDFRVWNVTFPATTICFHDKLDENKAKNVILREWGINETSDKFPHYYDFLSSIANLSYSSLNVLKKFQDDADLINKNLRRLTAEINFSLRSKIVVFEPTSELKLKKVFLEMGICYSYGSVLTNILAVSDSTSYLVDLSTMLNCNYLNSLCYGRIENLKRDVEYYIHSPNDIPSISSRSFSVRSREERDTTFRSLNIYSSDELDHLNAKQRRCLFSDEGEKNGVAGVYSFGLCEMRCRANIALLTCGCIPHFYPRFIPGIDKRCSIKGLLCIARYADKIVEITNQCNCMPQCDSTSYHVDKDTVQVWKPPVPMNRRFRWAIEKYSKTRLRRDVIFGLNDLLVSFGGTAGLFLGCSLLTGAEFIYYILIHLPIKCICMLQQKIRNEKMRRKKLKNDIAYLKQEYKAPNK